MDSVARNAATISIHALREEGDAKISHTLTFSSVISIHALREEGDSLSRALTLSTP